MTTTTDSTISAAFRAAFESHPQRETDPALAVDSARETASALVPEGVTGTFDDQTLTFRTAAPATTKTLTVHNYGARHLPVYRVTFDELERRGNAEPTSRLLDGSEDHWASEEWEQPSSVRGQLCTIYYLFDADDIVDADDEPLEADRYPWDAEHISWVELCPAETETQDD